METPFDGAEQARASARNTAADFSDGASRVKSAATSEIKNLIADVEELVARIADLKDADIARMRGRVMRAVDSAKESLSGSAETLKRQAQRVAATADDYVHDSPWQAVGIAAVLGAVAGILAARRS
jgi:ElaB/YqjD/DUF883 family membrane-anchored ribosome-binding protein